ncbi:MAG: hypothetical protein J6B71_07365, partial [Clostridia bacterium]|nr:hypothetical protein [Clostridia bacterium]
MTFGNIVIFGDSYSTFPGVVPKDFHVYYTGKRTEQPDLQSAEQLWWHRLMTETGSKVVQNNSFSGSSICNTVREWLDERSSFLSRFDRLVQEGFFQENEVNTVFILGATNDSWSNAPVGEVQFDHFEKQDLYSVLPALCCLIARMQAAIPGVRIVQVVNTGLKDEIVAGMKAASEHFKTDIVFLHDVEKIAG